MQADFAAIPDELWKRVAAWIPRHERDPRGGRKRIADRTAMGGILYRLRTGCQWDAIPSEFGSGSTCYRRFVEWRQAGVFHNASTCINARSNSLPTPSRHRGAS